MNCDVGEVHGALVDDDLAQAEIEAEAADLANGAALRGPLVLAAAEQRAHAADELGERARHGTQSSAPSSSARMQSTSLSRALSAITGTVLIDRSLRSTSSPESLRRSRSSRTRSTGPRMAACERGLAVQRLLDLVALAAEHAADRLPQLRRRVRQEDLALTAVHSRRFPLTQNGNMERRRFRVGGVVQGVGFRPFVYGLASRARLGGFVLNDGDGRA